MKKIILYISVIVFGLFFCTCEKDLVIKAPIPPLAPDTIVHTDIPDISLISSTMTHPSMCGLIPVPNDTIMSDSIDIDLDGTYDIKFIDGHYYNWVSASNPCSNYKCTIFASMLHSSDSIANYNSEYWWVGELNINDTINHSLNYFTFNPSISYHAAGAFSPPAVHNFTGEKYLGFKMYRSGKIMFGWVRIESIGYNGVIIKDFAINKTNNNFILAGNY